MAPTPTTPKATTSAPTPTIAAKTGPTTSISNEVSAFLSNVAGSSIKCESKAHASELAAQLEVSSLQSGAGPFDGVIAESVKDPLAVANLLVDRGVLGVISTTSVAIEGFQFLEKVNNILIYRKV